MNTARKHTDITSITAKEWKSKHPDFKGINRRDYQPHILQNDNGMTKSIPVHVEQPGFREARGKKLVHRGAYFWKDTDPIKIMRVYDNGVIKYKNRDTGDFGLCLFCELKKYTRPYFRNNHKTDLPRPGDLITDCETGKTGVVDSGMFYDPEQGSVLVCWNYHPPFCKGTDNDGLASLTISGGPFNHVPIDKIKQDGTKMLTCWNWCGNVAGADNGVRFQQKVKHFVSTEPLDVI